jgi:cellulose synthase/poly-beta-1,6-N-acetylglucosamine synthase-like glycosyltransferase
MTSTWRDTLGRLARHDGTYVLVAYLLFLGVPALAYVLLGAVAPWTMTAAHYAVAGAYAFTAAVMLLELRFALRRKRCPADPQVALEELPLVSVIVSAYLPNEQHLIVETLQHLTTKLNAPTHKLQIILAYNTDRDLPVERELRTLQGLNASFTALRVPGSSSKAHNINAALELVEGEMTLLLDADHHPAPDAIERAWRWLALGYDVVQGRCTVRNADESTFARYVAVEFEQIYGVSHTGRSHLLDTAVFGGTNGYWRTSLLKRLRVDEQMLTEDIDVSMRALLSGARLVHDRTIVSTEIGTAMFRSWWSQRMRWAQGWFQVTLRHQGAVWASGLPGPVRAYWTYLLLWRELFPLLSLQVLALLAADLATGHTIAWLGDPFLLGTTALTFASGAAGGLTTWRLALPELRRRLGPWFLVHALTASAYTTLKNTVCMAAMARELAGRRVWVVTRRSRFTIPETVAATT